MPRNIYKQYSDQATEKGIKRNTKDSIEWFRKTIRKRSNIGSFEAATAGLPRSRVRLEPGRLLTFTYNPKTKKTLPFYDVYPLILVMQIERKFIYGLNLHYLPPRLREDMLKDLKVERNNFRRISEIASRLPYSKFALKRYIPNRMKNTINIPKTEWEIAVQLPYEQFKGGVDNKNVWDMIKG